MAALTLRLPDDKHQRLRALAQSRGTTLNRVLDEMATLMLAELDAETRFKLRAARGSGKSARGLALLDKAAKRGKPQAT
jgi:predicted transcriptional regulator